MRFKFTLLLAIIVVQFSIAQKLKIVTLIPPAIAADTENPDKVEPNDELNDCKPDAELQVLLDLHNQARLNGVRCGRKRKSSVLPLQYSCRLGIVSYSHSVDMSQNNVLSHIGTDGSNITVRVDRVAYEWFTVGENIAQGFTSLQSVHDSWLNSKSHCNNIMNPDFTEMGAALVNGFWTVTFAGN